MQMLWPSRAVCCSDWHSCGHRDCLKTSCGQVKAISFVLVQEAPAPRGPGASASSEAWRGTNRVIKVANDWETERRKRFHYVIYADDNGAFTFRADCSPAGCGDIGTTPRKTETAPLFFQRLLLQHQPAVASPIMGDDSEPERMFACASTFDRKITAHHWSARHDTLLVLEEFLEVSMLAATTCSLNELAEATYRGYTILYRPFQRAGNGTRYYEHRGNYIQNTHPCLLRKVADEWEDSQLVSWCSQLSRYVTVVVSKTAFGNIWYTNQISDVLPTL